MALMDRIVLLRYGHVMDRSRSVDKAIPEVLTRLDVLLYAFRLHEAITHNRAVYSDNAKNFHGSLTIQL